MIFLEYYSFVTKSANFILLLVQKNEARKRRPQTVNQVSISLKLYDVILSAALPHEYVAFRVDFVPYSLD